MADIALIGSPGRGDVVLFLRGQPEIKGRGAVTRIESYRAIELRPRVWIASGLVIGDPKRPSDGRVIGSSVPSPFEAPDGPAARTAPHLPGRRAPGSERGEANGNH